MLTLSGVVSTSETADRVAGDRVSETAFCQSSATSLPGHDGRETEVNQTTSMTRGSNTRRKIVTARGISAWRVAK